MKDSIRPWILGIGSSHNGAACLLRGDEVFVAIQEERLVRSKRALHPASQDSLAVRYCLDYAGITPSDLSMVGVCSMQMSAAFDDIHLNPLLRTIANEIPTVRVSHHRGHAIGVHATSGFDRADILIVDGNGSPWDDLPEDERRVSPRPASGPILYETISTYAANGRTFEPIAKHLAAREVAPKAGMPRFFSLGRLFENVGMQIFGEPLDGPGKVMGLAPYGHRTMPPGDFFDIVDDEFRFREDVPGRFLHTDRWPARRGEYENLAASVQGALEAALLWLVSRLRERPGCAERLCYAGGVALNSVANERLVREGGYEDVFIMPAAEDSGTAIGAAYHALWQLRPPGARRRQTCDAMGRTYTADQIDQAIAKQPMLRREHAAGTEEARERIVGLLDEGKIVGWFQGGGELGPRALGQRSLLSDPRPRDMKDRLNASVKFRESFRPFAPVVLRDHVGDWFDTPDPYRDSPFMLRVMPFRPDKRDLVPAVVHVDGTGRVQTAAFGPLAELLRAFHRRTGVPILLNTSFNMAGEPIVETPEDALHCMLLTGVDACVFGDVIVTKAPEYRSVMNLCPVVNATWIQEHRFARGPGVQRYGDLFLSAAAGRLADIAHLVDATPRDHLRIAVDGPWGRVIHVIADVQAADMLRLMDGRRNAWSVLRAFGGADWHALEPWFRKLLARLVRASIVELRADTAAPGTRGSEESSQHVTNDLSVAM